MKVINNFYLNPLFKRSKGFKFLCENNGSFFSGYISSENITEFTFEVFCSLNGSTETKPITGISNIFQNETEEVTKIRLYNIDTGFKIVVSKSNKLHIINNFTDMIYNPEDYDKFRIYHIVLKVKIEGDSIISELIVDNTSFSTNQVVIGNNLNFGTRFNFDFGNSQRFVMLRMFNTYLTNEKISELYNLGKPYETGYEENLNEICKLLPDAIFNKRWFDSSFLGNTFISNAISNHDKIMYDNYFEDTILSDKNPDKKPDFIGQRWFNKNNKTMFISIGTNLNSWS